MAELCFSSVWWNQMGIRLLHRCCSVTGQSDQSEQRAEAPSNTQGPRKVPKHRSETMQRATVHRRRQVWGGVMPVRETECPFKYLISVNAGYHAGFTWPLTALLKVLVLVLCELNTGSWFQVLWRWWICTSAAPDDSFIQHILLHWD